MNKTLQFLRKDKRWLFAMIVAVVILMIFLWVEVVRERGPIKEIRYFHRTPEETRRIHVLDSITTVLYFLWVIPATWCFIDCLLYIFSPYVTKNLLCTAGMFVTSIVGNLLCFHIMKYWVWQMHYIGLTSQLVLPGTEILLPGLFLVLCIGMGSLWRIWAVRWERRLFFKNKEKQPEVYTKFDGFQEKMGWKE